MMATDSSESTVNIDDTICWRDGDPCVYNDNPATMSSILHCIKQFLDAHPNYKLLVENGCTLFRGKTVLDDITAISFIEGEYEDKTGVHNPVLDTPTRLARANETRRKLAERAGTPEAHKDYVAVTEKPADFSDTYILNKNLITEAKAKFYKIVAKVFRGSVEFESISEDIIGNGPALLAAFAKLGKTASMSDKAVVFKQYELAKTAKIELPLTVPKVEKHRKRLELCERDVPPESRATNEAKMMMIDQIALSDKEVSHFYELATQLEPPKTYTQSLQALTKVLRKMERTETLAELDNNGVAGLPNLGGLQALIVDKVDDKEPKGAGLAGDGLDSNTFELNGNDDQLAAFLAGTFEVPLDDIKSAGAAIMPDSVKERAALESSANAALAVTEHLLLEGGLGRAMDEAEKAHGECEACEPEGGESEFVLVGKESIVGEESVGSEVSNKVGAYDSSTASGDDSLQLQIGCMAVAALHPLLPPRGVANSEGSASRALELEPCAPCLRSASAALELDAGALTCANLGPAKTRGWLPLCSCGSETLHAPLGTSVPTVVLSSSDSSDNSITDQGTLFGGATRRPSELVPTTPDSPRPISSRRSPEQPRRPFRLTTVSSTRQPISQAVGLKPTAARSSREAGGLAPGTPRAAPRRWWPSGGRKPLRGRTFLSAASTGEHRLRYYGRWLPTTAGSALMGNLVATSTLESHRDAEEAARTGAFAHVDSGCTGTLTASEKLLVNAKPCDETFTAADGTLHRATAIGDMPVTVMTSTGELVSFIITNVRLVPTFRFTLLSVTQLWEEQRIDCRFANIRSLILPRGRWWKSTLAIPFAKDRRMPTLRIVGGTHAALASATDSPAVSSAAPSGARTVEPLPSPPQPPAPSPSLSPPPAPPQAPPHAPEEGQKETASRVSSGDQPALTQRGMSAPQPTDDGAEVPAEEPAEAQPVLVHPGHAPALGYHRVGTSSHVAKLSSARAAELLHRRSHLGLNKLRVLSHTTADAPKVLASAPAPLPCAHCVHAKMRGSPHPGSLDAPAPDPGKLHIDLKELVLGVGGYRYVMFAIDEHCRYVFYEYLKKKSEVLVAAKLIVAAFEATVGVPVGEDGKPLRDRPRVRIAHSDREGGLLSNAFKEFRADAKLHQTFSPPHDHDLNPIAERVIGVISEAATAVLHASHATPWLWPHIIGYVVDWHNSTVGAVGSSTADANISPYQCFTLRQPHVMDLATFGCEAFVLKPPPHTHKPSLSGRGWAGIFLGRSRNTRGCYSVLVGKQVVESSSVMVNEECFPMAPVNERIQPLTPSARAAPAVVQLPQRPALLPAPSQASAPAVYDTDLRFLSLFSGAYSRANGLPEALRTRGWSDVVQIDNDGEKGGGWSHDLLNDSLYAALLLKASQGYFDAIMVAFPCSTFSVTRLFDASVNGGDAGPPVLFTKQHPDGLPLSEIDEKHHREFRNAHLLLVRTANLVIAARRSPKRATIVFENPADRSIEASPCYAPEFANHGAIFGTSQYKRIVSAADLTGSATFAYCRLTKEPEYQKYTTLGYTPDAAPLLDELDGPDFKCNHERGTHSKRAGGRNASGEFISGAAAAYPGELNARLADAFTFARVGATRVDVPAAVVEKKRAQAEREKPPAGKQQAAADAPRDDAWWQGEPTPPAADARQPTSSTGGASPPRPTSSAGGASPPLASGGTPMRGFPNIEPKHGELRSVRTATRAANKSNPFGSPRVLPQTDPLSRYPTDGPDHRAVERANAERYAARRAQERGQYSPAVSEGGYEPFDESTARTPMPPGELPVPSDELSARENLLRDRAVDQGLPNLYGLMSPAPGDSPGYQADTALLAAAAEAARTMEEAVCDSTLAPPTVHSIDELVPITDWLSSSSGGPSGAAFSACQSSRLPGGWRAVDALDPELPDSVNYALRADSPDAPSSHKQAMRLGGPWPPAEEKEIGNHHSNGSWTAIRRSKVPKGRRIHRMLWVYKVKRDGTCKARLCVQGSSLEAGVDFDQVFSAALRYSSARGLFAFAARTGCRVRSVDLVAAYLQGKFVPGEVVFCELPEGYPEYDEETGELLVARVEKPIYGIQQAGRRLQRMLFAWLRDQGFRALDDSDPCVFSIDLPSGEILRLGVYVDNLQIVHSEKLDENGRGSNGCFYNKFMDALAHDWDVTDEGPMEDLLGIEIEYLSDGSIKLHQKKYIEKIVERFMPKGPTNVVQRGSLPFSKDFLQNIVDALSQTEVEHPELVKEMQQRIGCLMYAATSTRPDIAFPVHQLCKALHKPTPALIRETDYVLSYLSRHAGVGLTFTAGDSRLTAFADASWETRNSTSGWLVQWQSAALGWGSRKQKSIALSTCEAEIIALSEAAKDCVYFRKFVAGVGAPEPNETPLATDSKSARDTSYNPEHHDKMKHVERRHFFVRDMVESFEITVPYVNTAENLADFFTKPLNATKFHAMRRTIMNDFGPNAAGAPATSVRGGASRGAASEG